MGVGEFIAACSGPTNAMYQACNTLAPEGGLWGKSRRCCQRIAPNNAAIVSVNGWCKVGEVMGNPQMAE